MTCNTLLSKAYLTSPSIAITLLLGDGIEVSCGIHLLKVEDPPVGLKSQADLELCNAKTFDLIQMVQRCQTSDER